MALNIKGVALNKKFETADKLLDELGVWNTVEIGEADFEHAIASLERDDIFIIEVAGGTILFFGMSLNPQEMTMHFITKNIKGLTFIIGETAMVFAFEYYENQQRLRYHLQVSTTSISEDGEPLLEEQSNAGIEAVIYQLIEKITGESFHNIQPSAKLNHYKKNKIFVA